MEFIFEDCVSTYSCRKPSEPFIFLIADTAKHFEYSQIFMHSLET